MAAGAQCALHPDRAATATCERCGNFMCAECGLGGERALCPRCAELTGADGFPFNRENYQFGAVFGHAWAVFTREWLMLSLGTLVFVAVGLAVTLLTTVIRAAVGALGLPILSVLVAVPCQILAIAIDGIVIMGLIQIYIEALHGKPVDLNKISSQFANWGKYVLQQLALYVFLGIPFAAYLVICAAIGLVVSGAGLHVDWQSLPEAGPEWTGALVGLSLGLLIAIVPLFYIWLPFVFAPMELVRNPNVRVMDSLRNCWNLARGNRLPIFGYSFIAGLVMIVGMVLCCVGLLPAFALAQLLMVGLFLALRNGSTVRDA
jgi:hypothetical protein